MKAVLVSHKFNPGHVSHLMANYQLLCGAGFDVKFRWSSDFDMFTNNAYRGSLMSFGAVRGLRDKDLFIVWFPSLLALVDMMFIRVFTKATIIYVFHEPFSSLRSYKNAGFGLLKTARIALVSLVNFALTSLAHKLILPSSAALTAYRDRYNTTKPYAQFPLMFDDEATALLPLERREYVAYIGTVAEDHAFDEFLKFALWALENDVLLEKKVLIATRSGLAPETVAKLQPYINAGKAVIQSGRPLSNEEINGFFSLSIVVWNAYRRSMQSGVLPKAYMFGTPVLITSANRSEFFVDGVTGVEISPLYDAKEMLRAIRVISAGFGDYSKACRSAFSEKFYYKSFAVPFIDFVTSENHVRVA